MTVNDKGNIGLSKAVAEFVELGYDVFLPLADTDVIDLLVVNKNGDICRVQIKYRSITNKGVITVQTSGVINGKRVNINKNKIDYYVIYCPDNKKIYYVPISVFDNRNSISFRVNKSKFNQSNMIFAKDYEVFDF